MLIDANTLPSLADYGDFEATFHAHTKEIAVSACLHPRFSKLRLHDAHYAWRDDLARVADREMNGSELDHFKQCGHLAYWLRRTSPIIEYEDLAALYEEPGELYQNEESMRDLLYKYGSEYVAFDFGLQFCTFYELERTDRETPPPKSAVTVDSLNDICHMLKFKNVSPHAIYLIYRSILL